MQVDNPDSIDQLLYHSTTVAELYQDLLHAASKLDYKARNANMRDLQFELHSSVPLLYSMVGEIVDNLAPFVDTTYRRQIFDDCITQRKLHLLGCEMTLHPHPETYIFLVVTHTNAGQLNWFDKRWILRAPWLTAKLELK